jgi:TonB family protein
VGAAFEAETDVSAAREELRAIAALSQDSPWEPLAERLTRFDGELRLPVLLMAARRDGAAALPLFHRWESIVPPLMCETVLNMVTRGDPAALESAASGSLAAAQLCGWGAALKLLADVDRAPSEPLLAQALTQPVPRIRRETLEWLLRLAKPALLTGPVMAALESAADGEEAFLRELLLRAGGRAPREDEAWVSLLKGKDKIALDDQGLRAAAEAHFTRKERRAAESRWAVAPVRLREAQGPRPAPPPPTRTLANLPAGMAESIFEDAGCGVPAMSMLGSAQVWYAASGRPAAIDRLQMPFSPECYRAATLLLRAGLAPDDLVIDPEEAHTVMILLGKDQAARLDEAPPRDAARWIDETIKPPERTLFVKPEYPVSQRARKGEGKTILEMAVDRRGVPGLIRILKSTHGDFDRSAALAVSQWRYRPATLDGAAVPVWLVVVVDFNWQSRPPRVPGSVVP